MACLYTNSSHSVVHLSVLEVHNDDVFTWLSLINTVLGDKPQFPGFFTHANDSEEL